jgi:hypothetical protein
MTDQRLQHLVPFYEKMGFVSKGPSKAQFGGGGWVDMVSKKIFHLRKQS